ncbi:hypothetical protein, partial [Pectobacterium carotovorum]|uniref:hypothetical protein n=1 Tax=Pectobacterium carotovorum TaxID=554 RepID=UPI003F856C6F
EGYKLARTGLPLGLNSWPLSSSQPSGGTGVPHIVMVPGWIEEDDFHAPDWQLGKLRYCLPF